MGSYEVTLRCNGHMLPTILGCIEGSARLIKVEELPDAPTEGGPVPPAEKPRRYIGGIRNKGIRAHALMLEVMGAPGAAAVWSSQDLKRQFLLRGFAETSVSPTTSRLVAEQKLIRLGRDRFTLRGTQPVSVPQLALTR